MTSEKIGFTKKSIIKTKDIDKCILEMQQKEIESENFRKVLVFLDKYNKREALDKETQLFEILEKGSYDEFKLFIRNLSTEELISNIYLRTARKALNEIVFNCSKKIIKLNDELIDDETKEIGEVTFDLTEGMKDFIINKVNLSIDIITKNGKEEVEVLDKKNIGTYKDYNEIVDRINSMMVILYEIIFTSLASKLSVLIDETKFVESLVGRKVTIKYHVDEDVSKLFRDVDLKCDALKDTVYSREQILNMSLYSFSAQLNRMNLEKQRQKVFPN